MSAQLAGLTGVTRSLACLALGHEDGEMRACPSSDEELAQQLIYAVQSLRSLLGQHPDEDEAGQALAAALPACISPGVDIGGRPPEELAPYLARQLRAQGWQLVRSEAPD